MGVIFLTMTIGGLIIAAILLAAAYSTKTNRLKTFVLGGVVTWFAAYAILFFISSFFSVERTLNLNEPKEFCGFYLDCHLQTAVTDVRRAKTIGDKTANGEFYAIKVKVANDARRVELALHDPQFEVVDANNRRYKRIEDLTAPGNPFERKVPTGGAFEDEIVFDLPANVQNPRLDIREGIGIDRAIEAILIGDEDSLGHKRNYFKIEPRTQTASIR